MTKPIRIAVRLPDSAYLGRILLGALRAAHARKWIVSLGENAPAHMLRCGIRGIIGVADSTPEPREYRLAGIPFINVLGEGNPNCISSVILDNTELGRVAGEHLVQRGFRHFGFVGYGGTVGSARRMGFEETIRPRVRSFSECPVAYHNTPEDFEAMADWLRGLPKPVGVFAVDDAVGGSVTEVCQISQLRVPTDVAVISANDDGVRTLASEPELTSVRIPWERLGAEAVGLLDQYLQDGVAPTPIVLGPSGIAVRGSSDIVVITDKEAAAAAAFIQQNAHRHISVNDIAEATTISRRLLERRFKAVAGRTLLEQIRHTRLERAKQMLAESEQRVSDIARICGFGTRAQFHRLFHSDIGTTPEQFRQKNRDPKSLGY